MPDTTPTTDPAPQPIDDGGPAFPRAGFDGQGMSDPGDDGMALRDWFAGQALMGSIAGRSHGTGLHPDVVAIAAYAFADAMLAARKAVRP